MGADGRAASDEPRLIRVRRTGGVAGIAAEASVGVDDLSPEEREALAQLVGSGRTEPPTPSRARQAPDAFQYELTISRGGHDERIIAGEGDLPAVLREALARAIREDRSK